MITVVACLAGWAAGAIVLGVLIGKAMAQADCCPHDEADCPDSFTVDNDGRLIEVYL